MCLPEDNYVNRQAARTLSFLPSRQLVEVPEVRGTVQGPQVVLAVAVVCTPVQADQQRVGRVSPGAMLRVRATSQAAAVVDRRVREATQQDQHELQQVALVVQEPRMTSLVHQLDTRQAEMVRVVRLTQRRQLVVKLQRVRMPHVIPDQVVVPAEMHVTLVHSGSQATVVAVWWLCDMHHRIKHVLRNKQLKARTLL